MPRAHRCLIAKQVRQCEHNVTIPTLALFCPQTAQVFRSCNRLDNNKAGRNIVLFREMCVDFDLQL